MELTAAQQKYFAYWLTRSLLSGGFGNLAASLQDTQVYLPPLSISAALFAFKPPLSKGAILADEVRLGKTIEAGIILSQFWAEFHEKFFLPPRILEAKTFKHYCEDGNLGSFNMRHNSKLKKPSRKVEAMLTQNIEQTKLKTFHWRII